MKRQLTQQEIDDVFSGSQDGAAVATSAKDAPVFDFRRPDRIAKSQLRAIHILHENFVRSVVSSVSAYLRTYVIVNLVSVEQISYSEFLEGLPSSTLLASLGLKPYDGNAVLELNPSLVFPILEMLLGGTGKTYANIQREVTEIEQNLMDGFLRLILHDLKEAWKSVTNIDFSIQSLDTEPQFLQVMAPNEAVVAVGIEMRLGDSTGLLNMAMPSLMIKMIRHKFDQQWSMRKADTTDADQRRMLGLLRNSAVSADARLHGSSLAMRDLLALKAGDCLVFDHPVERPIDCALNGMPQFKGSIVPSGRRMAFRVSGPFRAD